MFTYINPNLNWHPVEDTMEEFIDPKIINYDLPYACQVVNEHLKFKRGKDECETYINYSTKAKDILKECINQQCDVSEANLVLNSKNEKRAKSLRATGNDHFGKGNDGQAKYTFTSSLCAAEFNGEAYSMALANRSAVFFAEEEYLKCISDIDSCLQGAYPNHLKPKVYIRKAKCYKHLHEPELFKSTLNDATLCLDNTHDLTDDAADKYRNEIAKLSKDTVDVLIKTDSETSLPLMDPNPNFLGASSAVSLEYNSSLGRHVVAKKQLQLGDVLFVEKAYMINPLYNDRNICNYCFKQNDCEIPCKMCQVYKYCNAECRDEAWNEYHQWECEAVKRGFFKMFFYAQLAFRTIAKASKTGFPTISTDFMADTINYGSEIDNYPYVNKLVHHAPNYSDQALAGLCATATIFTYYLNTRTTFFNKLRENTEFSNSTDEDIHNKLASIFMKLCSQFSCNVTLMRTYTTMYREIFSMGIYPSVSMMNHFCDANTANYFVNDTIVVKASRTIEAGEQIFCDHRNNSVSNAKPDEEYFGFKCKCKFCTDDLYNKYNKQVFACIKCGGPAVSSGKIIYSHKCLKCKEMFDLPQDIFEKNHAICTYLGPYSRSSTNSSQLPSNCEDLLDKTHELMKQIYDPTHKSFAELFWIGIKYQLSTKEGINRDRLNMMIQYARENHTLRFGEMTRQYVLLDFDIAARIYEIVRRAKRDSTNSEIFSVATDFCKGAIGLQLWYPSVIKLLDDLIHTSKEPSCNYYLPI